MNDTKTNTLAPTDAPDILEIARRTGLRGYLTGVNAQDARALLKAFVDALPAPESSEPVAVPAGMEPVAYRRPDQHGGFEYEDGITSFAHDPTSDSLYTAAQVQAMLSAGMAPGWQAVPIEPTSEMVIEAYKAQGEATSSACEEIYRAMLAAAPSAPALERCSCHACWPMSPADPSSISMRLCPSCGNKRCPRANDHRYACSGSNIPGQPGSAYPAAHGITAAQKGGQ